MLAKKEVFLPSQRNIGFGMQVAPQGKETGTKRGTLNSVPPYNY